MTAYTFYINEEYSAPEGNKGSQPGELIRDLGDAYDLVETDSFDDKCLLSAITDDILFGS